MLASKLIIQHLKMLKHRADEAAHGIETTQAQESAGPAVIVLRDGKMQEKDGRGWLASASSGRGARIGLIIS
jgi:hypothetical protein